MSLIDLSIEFAHPDVSSSTITYGRIDNIATPTFITVPNVSVSPYNITVPAGQYQITITPDYPDGRKCAATTFTTEACPGVIALNAVQEGNNLVVTYTAPPSAVQVLVTVSFPNGGSYQKAYTNGNAIVIELPANQFGDFTVTMQTVCDPNTDISQPPFLSPPSAPVVVTVPATQNAPALVGTVSVICNGDCSAQVNGALQFNLTAPLSSPLVLNIAYQIASPTGAQQFGCSIIPAPDLTGTCTYNGYATVTIPAGQLQYTTPLLFFAPSPGYGSGMIGLICFCGSNPDVTLIYITKLFLQPVNAPNIAINLTAEDSRITIVQI